jgi:RNA polymerase sigma-70 factor (ECF subfamily)
VTRRLACIGPWSRDERGDESDGARNHSECDERCLPHLSLLSRFCERRAWFGGGGGPVRPCPTEPEDTAATKHACEEQGIVIRSRRPAGGRTISRDLAHLSDEALVALVGRSDETALAELYDRFGRVAYGLALRIVRDPALAEDAVQEAFLSVWRSAGRFVAERAKASTWIMTLVHRRAVDLVRREEPRRTEPLESAPQPALASTEDEAWLLLQRQRVREALRRLPDQQREAIELAYYGGYTQSELADRLGQPLGTIKSRMFAGLSRLREILAETGEIEEETWTTRP